GYVVFAIILCKLLHYSLIGNLRLRCTMVGRYAPSRSASHRMKPTGAERDGREGRTAERAGASESNALRNLGQVVGSLYQTPTSIRGNNGTGLPTTCPSGSLPHSASASEKRSSFPHSSIFQFSWSKIPCAARGSTGEIKIAMIRSDSATW